MDKTEFPKSVFSLESWRLLSLIIPSLYRLSGLAQHLSPEGQQLGLLYLGSGLWLRHDPS